MKRTSKSLADLFFRGDHSLVLDRTIDSERGELQQEFSEFVIGALAFTGRLEEAQFLYDKFAMSMSQEQLVAARFYLAVGLCRHSEYSRAAAYFLENRLTHSRERQSPLIGFYALQGLGFYLLFCGRFKGSLKAAKKALFFAIDSGFLYGKFLATDLIAHALVQNGFISEGLKNLQSALKYARLFGNGGMAHATEIGIVCYEAQFGRLGDRAIEKLSKVNKVASPHNSYSKANLLLELARQCTLSGKVTLSGEYLDEACRIIYSVKHRRQGALLSLRYAYNLYLSGEKLQALNLIRTAQTEINKKVDIALELPLVGFEIKLVKELGIEEGLNELIKRLVYLTHRVGSGVGNRMLCRLGLFYQKKLMTGEDVIGDLLDLPDSDARKIPLILKIGTLNLLRPSLGVQSPAKLLFPNLAPGGLLLVDGGEIAFYGKGVTPKMRLLMRELSRKEQSKSALIEKIWGYKYHSLRHDPLIYSAISRLRELLGERESWIEITEKGYRLNRSVLFVESEVQEYVEDIKLEQRVTDLSFRQIQLMKYVQNKTVLDVKSCTEIFGVSRITATRDLSDLCKKKILTRHGKGRATKYTIANL